ncbi:uncharacterized protein LOC111466606 [Cucurbita maxima]|uniref:Uncharacterized protein LOC111466606 n=1 Tax=Cucurbita maxima TaxID=3661 RepID=A0A6J1HPU4_CUCMA|nr:uncharacterized protein LOC111466606 [Cucurbita maxima]
MELSPPSSRFRHRKSPPSERFLLSFSSPSPRPSNPTSANALDDDNNSELNEDDVFWTGDFAADSAHHTHSTPSSSSSSTPRHHIHHLQHHKGFPQSETFGILAALPENEASSSLRNSSHFYHKASVSSSSSSSPSSSRMIPTIPKPPLERLPLTISSSLKYQSAPVNVPMMSKAAVQRHQEIDVDDVDESDGEMLPPHEIVARSLAQSPLLSCSVLEGAGRTLKGRDLRQVRNAVWRRTGFLD